MHDRLRALSNESLIKAFKKEIKIFVHMKMTDQIATSIREALVSLPRDSNETASFAAETDPVALKREWINKLVKQINDLRKPKKAKAPVPDQFDEVLESLEKSEAEKRVPDPHPRGTGELAPPPLGGDDSFSSSSGEDNSEDSDERSDEDEGRQHGTQKRSEGQQKYNESPLATDPAVQGHLRRIKGLKKVQDLDLRTVDWITDLFSNNSNHIRRVVDGTHRDVNWARQEFKHACVYILSLWQKVRDREEAVDALAAKTKAAMLKSEFRLLAEIRENLHVIRLGRIGAARFRQKIEDEKARASFEEANGSSKAFRLFAKELEETRKRDSSRYAALRFRRTSSASAPASRPRSNRRRSRGRRPRPSRSQDADRPRRPAPRGQPRGGYVDLTGNQRRYVDPVRQPRGAPSRDRRPAYQQQRDARY